ncbi:MAG: hypothetical protein JNJ90_00465 [Saprospiraceae bacterium]|jgi:hypothetical protein|nr:hypothetical protein [Saprospiraceae bacterium]
MGKAFFDFLQHLLSQDAWFRWIVCIVLVYLIWQILRILRLVLRHLVRWFRKTWRFTFVWGRRNLLVIAALGTLLWAFSNPLLDLLQSIEQRYFSPVFLNDYGNWNEAHLTAIFEEELGKQVDPYQKMVVMRRTREMAEKIQSTPLAIYEAAYLECGLNPFRVRTDRVAAGWIQFTRAGLASLRYHGKPVSMNEVFRACETRDIEFMMDLTELYLVRKYEQSGRKPLHNTIDLYLALFAPAHIGAPSDKVVYAGLDNPSYFKNAGLDGWFVVRNAGDRQQIVRERGARDGKITIWEIYLAIEAKKGRLVRSYAR